MGYVVIFCDGLVSHFVLFLRRNHSSSCCPSLCSFPLSSGSRSRRDTGTATTRCSRRRCRFCTTTLLCSRSTSGGRGSAHRTISSRRGRMTSRFPRGTRSSWPCMSRGSPSWVSRFRGGTSIPLGDGGGCVEVFFFFVSALRLWSIAVSSHVFSFLPAHALLSLTIKS